MAFNNLPIIPRKGPNNETIWDFEQQNNPILNIGLNSLTYDKDGTPTLVSDDSYNFSQFIVGLSRLSGNEVQGYLTDDGVAYDLNGETHIIDECIIDFSESADGRVLVCDSEPAIIHLDKEAMLELINSDAVLIANVDSKYDVVPFFNADREIDVDKIKKINDLAEITAVYIENNENIVYSIPENIDDYKLIGIISHPDLDTLINPNDEKNVVIIFEDKAGKQISCISPIDNAINFEMQKMQQFMQENKACVCIADKPEEPNIESNIPKTQYDSVVFIKDIEISKDSSRIIANVSVLGEESQKTLGVPIAVDTENGTITFRDKQMVTSYPVELNSEKIEQINKIIKESQIDTASIVKIGVVEKDALTYKYAIQDNNGKFYNADNITYFDNNGNFAIITENGESKLFQLKEFEPEITIDAISVSEIGLFDPKQQQLLTIEKGQCYEVDAQSVQAIEESIIRAGFNKVDDYYVNPQLHISPSQKIVLTDEPMEVTMNHNKIITNALIEQKDNQIVLTGDNMKEPVNLRKLSVETIDGTNILVAEGRDHSKYNISSFNEAQKTSDLSSENISTLTRQVNILTDSVGIHEIYMFKNDNQIYTKINNHYLCISDSSVPSKDESSTPFRTINVDERVYDEMVERASGKFLQIKVNETDNNIKITVEALDERYPGFEKLEKLTTFTANDIVEAEDIKDIEKEKDVPEFDNSRLTIDDEF